MANGIYRFNERYEHMDTMEGWVDYSYSAGPGSGITLGYGIDLWANNTVAKLVAYGIPEKQAKEWKAMGILGKKEKQLLKEGLIKKGSGNRLLVKKLDGSFEKLSIPSDDTFKKSMAEAVFKDIDSKILEEYKDKVPGHVYDMITTMYHFGGGKGIEGDVNSKVAQDAKDASIYNFFQKIDKIVDEGLTGRDLISELTEGLQSDSLTLKGRGSPRNSRTLTRELEYLTKHATEVGTFELPIEEEEKRMIGDVEIPETTLTPEEVERYRQTRTDIDNLTALSTAKRDIDENAPDLQGLTVQEALDLNKIIDYESKQFGKMLQGRGAAMWQDDDANRKEYFKLMKNKLGINQLDLSNPEDLATARATIEYFVGYVQGDEYAEDLMGQGRGGWKKMFDWTGLTDTALENMFEDWFFKTGKSGTELDATGKVSGGKFLNKGAYFDMGVAKEGDIPMQALKNIYNTNPDLAKIIYKDVKNPTFGLLPGIGNITGDVGEFGDVLGGEVASYDLGGADALSMIANMYGVGGEWTGSDEQYEQLYNNMAQTMEGTPKIGKGQTYKEAVDLLLDGPPEAVVSPTDETVVETPAVEGGVEVEPGEDGLDDKTQNLLYNTLTALKAGAGITNLSKAMQEIDIEEFPEMSDAWDDYMERARKLSKTGFSADEMIKAKSDLSNAYSSGVKHILRASGGSRGTYLANVGVLNANRIKGLVDLAAKDAEMERKNMANYGTALSSQEQLTHRSGILSKTLQYQEDARVKTLQGNLGSKLVDSFMGDIEEAKLTAPGSPYSMLMEQMRENQKQSSSIIQNLQKELGESITTTVDAVEGSTTIKTDDDSPGGYEIDVNAQNEFDENVLLNKESVITNQKENNPEEKTLVGKYIDFGLKQLRRQMTPPAFKVLGQLGAGLKGEESLLRWGPGGKPEGVEEYLRWLSPFHKTKKSE
jgi:hypothetical protein